MKYPKRSENVTIVRNGDEAVVNSLEGKQIHILNTTALFIWNRLDGQTSIETIAEKMKDAFTVHQGHDLFADVQNTVEKLQSLNLLDPR